jgi:hypothetical protein
MAGDKERIHYERGKAMVKTLKTNACLERKMQKSSAVREISCFNFFRQSFHPLRFMRPSFTFILLTLMFCL